MSLKLQAKYKSYDEMQAVQDAAKYLNMTEKEFLRQSSLKMVKNLIEEINRRTKEVLDAQAINQSVESGTDASQDTDSAEGIKPEDNTSIPGPEASGV